MERISGPDELRDLLASQGVDTSRWGQGEAKSFAEFWDEMTHGDSRLQIEPFLRVVDVAQCVVRRKGKILIESGQEFRDGRTRSRKILPSEKIRPDESVFEAVRRGLREEMGLAPGEFEILEQTYRRDEKIQESPSYPGLRTKYLFHLVDVNIPGLPDTGFVTRETGSGSEVVKEHVWVWIKQEDL